MDGTYAYPDDTIRNVQNNFTYQRTDEIFEAFVDAIIPRTPGLAAEYGRIQNYGALDQYTDEYLIMTLNNLYLPIARPTAEMLEIAAGQLDIYKDTAEGREEEYIQWSRFGELLPINRLWAITLLEQYAENFSDLPEPFYNDKEYVLYITSALNRYTMMGYYSEWFGYGSTRLMTPNQRRLEYYPVSWAQVGYPGPSLGYHALRINTQ